MSAAIGGIGGNRNENKARRADRMLTPPSVPAVPGQSTMSISSDPPV